MSKTFTCGLAVFVKTPGYSPIKTRLAKSIGQQGAMQLYKFSLAVIEKTLLETCRLAPQLKAFWAVAEEQAKSDSLWCNFETLSQGGGDLGSRLSFVYNDLLSRFGRAIIIGADSPQITSACLIRTLELISSPKDIKQVIIGPAEDGGFYLFAGSTPIAESLWKAVSYSSDDTLAQLKSRLPTDLSVLELEKAVDLDSVGDLVALKRSLLENLPATPERNNLLTAIQKYL